MFGEQAGSGRPDAGGRAGDDGNGIFEFHDLALVVFVGLIRGMEPHP